MQAIRPRPAADIVFDQDAIGELFNDKVLELLVKLVRSVLGLVGQLDGLAKVKAEDTEDRLAVYLVFAGLKVYVAVESNENVNELINVIDLSELNIKCHNSIPFKNVFVRKTIYNFII